MKGKINKAKKFIAIVSIFFLIPAFALKARAEEAESPIILKAYPVNSSPNYAQNFNLYFPEENVNKQAVLDLSSYRYIQKNFQPNKTEKFFFASTLVTLAALNIADYFSTREALRYPQLGEANPLMKNVVKSPAVFAAVKIGTIALSTTLLSKLHKNHKEVAWVLSIVSNLAISYVVSNNFKLINRVKNR